MKKLLIPCFLGFCIDIKVVTRGAGNENSWTFGNCNSAQEYKWWDIQFEKCCQPKGTYQLACRDSDGDGWHGGYIEIEGKKYCENFNSGRVEYHSVETPGKPRFNAIFFLPNLKNPPPIVIII